MTTLNCFSEFNETPDVKTASSDYAKRFSGKTGNFFLDTQKTILFDMLASMAAPSILDVGGGHAQLAAPLARRGMKVTVTGSHHNCRIPLEALIDSGAVGYRTCNLFELPFADRQFDVVLAFRLLAHLSRWDRFVSELCRVARRAVILDYPDIRSFNAFYPVLFGVKKRLEKNTRPFIVFHRRNLLREFRKNGFGRPVFRPEFFLPMVLHRIANNVAFSRTAERLFHLAGVTRRLGSPTVFKVERLDNGQPLRGGHR